MNPTFRSNNGNSNDPSEGLETTMTTGVICFFLLVCLFACFFFGGEREGWMQAGRWNPKILLQRRPPVYFQMQRPGLRFLYSACTYVDRLPVALIRPMAVVSLAAKPQRKVNAYKKSEWLFKTNCFTRDISEGAMDTAFALYQCVSRYISGLYAVGVLIISPMTPALHSLQWVFTLQDWEVVWIGIF